MRSFVFILLTMVVSSLTADPPSLEQMTEREKLTFCAKQLNRCEDQLKISQEQIRLLELQNQKLKGITQSDKEFFKKAGQAEQACKALIENKNQLIAAYDETKSILTADRAACYQELDKVKAAYDELYDDYSEPWYQNAMFYLGVLLGLATGLAF